MDGIVCGALGLVNVSCLASWLVQWQPLVGERGVTPAVAYVRQARTASGLDAEPQLSWRRVPDRKELLALRRFASLFVLTGASDTAMRVAIAIGFVASVALFWGWAPSLACLVFAAVWASISNVSAPWTSLQFESMLVETNVAFGLGYAFAWVAPSAWVIMLRWLVVRLMVAAGAGKLAGGDAAWRARTPEVSAMRWHYLTQPLPNRLSRYFHRLPLWWHQLETRLTFVFEGPLMLLALLPQPLLRGAAFLGNLGFQLAIALTGNYGFLHSAVLVMSLAIVTEAGSTAVAPWCDALSLRLAESSQAAVASAAAQTDGGSHFAVERAVAWLMPSWATALQTWWRLWSGAGPGTDAVTAAATAAAAASATSPVFMYQLCPVQHTSLLSPARLLQHCTWEALRSQAAAIFTSAAALLHAAAGKWPVEAASTLLAISSVVAILLGMALWTAAWLAAWAVAAAYIALSCVPFAGNFEGLVDIAEPLPLWDRLVSWCSRFERWRAIGSYNLFVGMTRFRWELIIEGTADGVNWFPYRYHNKPGGPPASLDDPPRTLAPGHFMRSDWRMWFLPLQAARLRRAGVDVAREPSLRPPYYTALMKQLLQGNEVVGQLVIAPPQLAGKRLLAVRTLMWDYHFSDGKTSAVQVEAARAARVAAEQAGQQQPDSDQLARGNHHDSSDHHDAAAQQAASASELRAQAQAPMRQPQLVTLNMAHTDQLPQPDGEWQEGLWWRRRYVDLYDAYVAPRQTQLDILQEQQPEGAQTAQTAQTAQAASLRAKQSHDDAASVAAGATAPAPSRGAAGSAGVAAPQAASSNTASAGGPAGTATGPASASASAPEPASPMTQLVRAIMLSAMTQQQQHAQVGQQTAQAGQRSSGGGTGGAGSSSDDDDEDDDEDDDDEQSYETEGEPEDGTGSTTSGAASGSGRRGWMGLGPAPSLQREPELEREQPEDDSPPDPFELAED